MTEFVGQQLSYRSIACPSKADASAVERRRGAGQLSVRGHLSWQCSFSSPKWAICLASEPITRSCGEPQELAAASAFR